MNPHHSMVPTMSRPLHVLLVAHDRALLRRGALMLQQFGIDATTCADPARVLHTIVGGNVDLVIADDQTLGRNLNQIADWKAACPEHLPVFLLCSAKKTIHFEDALASGVDDFVRHPLSPAEVLARLRVAARLNEFERRFDAQSWHDKISGCAGRQAMIDRLSGTVKSNVREQALLALELDYFESWQYRHGALAAQKVLRDIAGLIDELGSGEHFGCRWLDHQFVILLSGHTLESATKAAEELRQGIQRLDLPSDDLLTASVGIAMRCAGDTPDAWLQRAWQALEDVQYSGRDGVATHGQFGEERRKWSQQVNGGNPFAACVARDVLTPFVVELNGSDTVAYADALLTQMQLDLLPIVDARQRCTGVVFREDVQEWLQTPARAKQPIEQFATTDIAQIIDSTPFASLIEHFAQGDQSLLIVHAKDGRLRGYIERSHFLNLVKSLDSDHFAAETYSPRTEYLVVPDLVAEGALEGV
jgi:diguanylate cyclase (GGDEF)-like protein